MIYTLQWFRFHDVFSLIQIILLFSDALISERPTVPVNVASIQGIDGGKDTCPRCGGQVFHAERMLSKVSMATKTFFTTDSGIEQFPQEVLFTRY